MKKILIVDDEPAIVELLRAEFSGQQYHVMTASGGKECLERMHQEAPDLVVLDVAMPDLSGNQVALLIKKEPQFQNIPIIFLTGLLSKDDEAHTGNEIANQVIFAKPLSLQKLSGKVKEMLAKK